MKKLKALAIIGLVVVSIGGALIIWAGVVTFNFVAGKTNEILQSPTTQQAVDGLATELKALPHIQPMDCWAKTQSLFVLQPWLERPTIENLKELKAACFKEPPPG